MRRGLETMVKARTETDAETRNARKCIVTGTVGPKETMVRFVAGPDGNIVPDIEGKLPGRGFWLSAERDVVNTACAKNHFAKAARRQIGVADGMADLVDRLLARRCMDLIGLARRAGQAVAGFEKVKARQKTGQTAVLLAASDGAADGRAKIRALAPQVPLLDLFGRRELGAAMGRDDAVHVALAPGRLAQRLLEEAGRLAGFRSSSSEQAPKRPE